jgi:hypothetical protein
MWRFALILQNPVQSGQQALFDGKRFRAHTGGMMDTKASRELDALVAEKVMGWKAERRPTGNLMAILPDDSRVCVEHVQGCLPARRWNPSEDIAVAWEVVEKMRERGLLLKLHQGNPHGWTAQFAEVWHVDLTAPLAICLAALKAIGVKAPMRGRP